jgi:hypothetical protein
MSSLRTDPGQIPSKKKLKKYFKKIVSIKQEELLLILKIFIISIIFQK